MVLRSIGVLSAGKIMGTLYAAIGVLLGAMFALISLSGLALHQPGNGPNPMGFLLSFGAAAIIILPIMYGILGFIGGIMCAAIYNFVAGFVGGIEMDFERRADIVIAP